MKCVMCKKGIEDHASLYPIEPKGTPDRKWACTKCISLRGLVVDSKPPKEKIPDEVI